MTSKNSPGRPFIEVNWEIVDKFIQYQCTCEEVAGELGIHPDTLTARIQEKDGGIYSGFSAYASSKKSCGKARLRATQFTQALKGNTKMLDKLGDVYLGQARKEIEIPPNDKALETLHEDLDENKSLKEQIEKLKREIDALKSKADPILSGSD